MKPARIPQIVSAPAHWAELPWGEYYREALEQQLKPWFAKMYGFHLLKIGNLSAEINSESCGISHQVNVSLGGEPVQVKANPLHLPFAEKSVDACLLAHSLPWCDDPHRLLREADRVLIDDGWLVISGFNPMSLMNDNKSVSGINLGHLWHRGDLIKLGIETVLDLYRAGKVAPHLDGTYPFDKAADAYGRLENGKNIGKVVLVP